jgi:hypothetical protein
VIPLLREAFLVTVSKVGIGGIALGAFFAGWAGGRRRFSMSVVRVSRLVLFVGLLVLAAALGGGSKGIFSKETIGKGAILVTLSAAPLLVGWALGERDPARRRAAGWGDTAWLALLASVAATAWPVRLSILAGPGSQLSTSILGVLGLATAYVLLALGAAWAPTRGWQAGPLALAVALWAVFAFLVAPAMDTLRRGLLLVPVAHMAVWSLPWRQESAPTPQAGVSAS